MKKTKANFALKALRALALVAIERPLSKAERAKMLNLKASVRAVYGHAAA